MRETQELKAEPRPATGKGPAYQARLKGFTPGIIYGGKNAAPEPVMVASRELEKHVSTGSFLTTLYMVELNGKKTRVIPRDVQLRPGHRPPRACRFHAAGKGRDDHARYSGALQRPGRISRA